MNPGLGVKEDGIMAMEITANRYNGYAAQAVAEDVRKKETERIDKPAQGKPAKTGSVQEYVDKLQKQVPYMTLEAGSALSMAKDKRMGVVTMNPQLLEKMQNDPEAEEKYTQLLKDIERAEQTASAYYNSMGGCVERTSHWYIDENGKYYHFAYTRRDDKLNKKLREETQKNAERQVEKARERSCKSRELLEERIEVKAEKSDETKGGVEGHRGDAAGKVVERVISEKLKSAKNGEIYLNAEDMQPVLEAFRERAPMGPGADGKPIAGGTGFDLQV